MPGLLCPGESEPHSVKKKEALQLHLFISLNEFMVCVCARACASVKTMEQLLGVVSLSTMWIPGVETRSLGLIASTFPSEPSHSLAGSKRMFQSRWK